MIFSIDTYCGSELEYNDNINHRHLARNSSSLHQVKCVLDHHSIRRKGAAVQPPMGSTRHWLETLTHRPSRVPFLIPFYWRDVRRSRVIPTISFQFSNEFKGDMETGRIFKNPTDVTRFPTFSVSHSLPHSMRFIPIFSSHTEAAGVIY